MPDAVHRTGTAAFRRFNNTGGITPNSAIVAKTYQAVVSDEW
jgi:hypothetical protein